MLSWGITNWPFPSPVRKSLKSKGPDAIKWTYTMMLFGPTNDPATFINFIHDVDSQWKALAQKSGVVIDNNTNTKKYC
jgi:hypothetical protein